MIRLTGLAVRIVAPAARAAAAMASLIAPMPPSGIESPALPAGLAGEAVQQREH